MLISRKSLFEKIEVFCTGVPASLKLRVNPFQFDTGLSSRKPPDKKKRSFGSIRERRI
jgi:hypothetical protein